eukprot:312258-Hanusia_phi.AAC.2
MARRAANPAKAGRRISSGVERRREKNRRERSSEQGEGENDTERCKRAFRSSCKHDIRLVSSQSSDIGTTSSPHPSHLLCSLLRFTFPLCRKCNASPRA